MEEGKTEDKGVYESDELYQNDCERVCDVLEKIVKEGRIIKTMGNTDSIDGGCRFEKFDR